jgi:hypothetical protein
MGHIILDFDCVPVKTQSVKDADLVEKSSNPYICNGFIKARSRVENGIEINPTLTHGWHLPVDGNDTEQKTDSLSHFGRKAETVNLCHLRS